MYLTFVLIKRAVWWEPPSTKTFSNFNTSLLCRETTINKEWAWTYFVFRLGCDWEPHRRYCHLKCGWEHPSGEPPAMIMIWTKWNLQGVPQLSSHFVLLVFSASRARTEVHFTIFQQPRRRGFQNSPYFPPYVKNWSSYRAKHEANWI